MRGGGIARRIAAQERQDAVSVRYPSAALARPLAGIAPVLILMLLLSLGGCTDHGAATLAPDDHGQLDQVSYALEIQPIWDTNCIVCHGAGGSGGMDLRASASYIALVNTAANGYPGLRVTPGDPHVSVLYRKLEGDPATGERMPFGEAALPPAQRLLIHNWIEQGALNN